MSIRFRLQLGCGHLPEVLNRFPNPTGCGRPVRELLDWADMSVALRKGAIWAPTWSLCLIAVRKEPFPLPAIGFSERTGAVKGAPLLGAAKRTLDGEDRSKIIRKRERPRRKISENVGRQNGPFARRHGH
jgi:hypothetical protein